MGVSTYNILGPLIVGTPLGNYCLNFQRLYGGKHLDHSFVFDLYMPTSFYSRTCSPGVHPLLNALPYSLYQPRFDLPNLLRRPQPIASANNPLFL